MNPEDPSLKETAILPRGEAGDELLVVDYARAISAFVTSNPNRENDLLAKVDSTRDRLNGRLATLRQEVERLKSENFLLQRKLDIALDEYEKRVGERDVMRKALEEIAKAEGKFDLNPLEHACNCVLNMQEIAVAALAHPVSAPERK